MKPTNEILQKAINSIKTSFTTDVVEFGFIPRNYNQFGISIVNVRDGKQMLLDYYFTIKTGKLVKCIKIWESTRIVKFD